MKILRDYVPVPRQVSDIFTRSVAKKISQIAQIFLHITQVEIEDTDCSGLETTLPPAVEENKQNNETAMEDKKGSKEQMVKAQAIKLNLEVEELEKREAPMLAAKKWIRQF